MNNRKCTRGRKIAYININESTHTIKLLNGKTKKVTQPKYREILNDQIVTIHIANRFPSKTRHLVDRVIISKQGKGRVLAKYCHTKKGTMVKLPRKTFRTSTY